MRAATLERPAVTPWRPDPDSAHTELCQLLASFGGEQWCPIECLIERLGLTIDEALAVRTPGGRGRAGR